MPHHYLIQWWPVLPEYVTGPQCVNMYWKDTNLVSVTFILSLYVHPFTHDQSHPICIQHIVQTSVLSSAYQRLLKLRYFIWPCFNIKPTSSGMGIPFSETVIFMMVIFLLVRQHFYIEMSPTLPASDRLYEYMLVQYIPRNMHTVLLCFALLWLCNRS